MTKKLIATFIGLLLACTSVNAEFIGVTAALKGEVLRTASVTPNTPIGLLESGDKVFLGDQIKVSDTGRLQVLLVDETVFTLGSGAEMTIDQFVYDPAKENQLSANIQKGAFRFVSGKIAKSKKDAMKVAVPGATIAVRGTQVAGLIDDNGRSNIVLLGPGPNSFGATPGAISVFNDIGSVDILRGGYGLAVAVDEPPGAVEQAEPALLERLERAVSELASEEIAANIPEEFVTERIVELAETLVEKGVTGTNVTNDVEVLRLISEEGAQALSDDGVNFDAGAAILLARYSELLAAPSPPPGPSLADLQSAAFSGSRTYAATGVQMTSANVVGGTGSGSFDVTTIYDFDAGALSQSIAGAVENIKINSGATANFNFSFSGTTDIANMTTALNGEPSFVAASIMTQASASSFTAPSDVDLSVGDPVVAVPNTFTGSPAFGVTNLVITGNAASGDTLHISTNGGLTTVASPGDIGFTNISVLSYNGLTDNDNVGGTAVTVGQ